MGVVLARVHLTASRLGGALRHHWLRIVLGAICGWFAASVIAAFVLVGLEAGRVVTSDEIAALIAAVLGWSGVGLGAIIAYAMRRPKTAHP